VFGNRVLRIFGPKRDEVTAEHVARMGKNSNTYRLVVSKPEGKRPLGRAGCEWRIIFRWILKR
jgi:hypothetical protein